VNPPKEVPIVEIVEDEEYMEQLSPFDTNHLLLGREKSKEKPNPT
jgi:DNA relaxase NicK